MIGGAVESVDLRARHQANEPAQVEAVVGEVVRKKTERWGGRFAGLQVVHRLDQRTAEQQGPDPVDGRAGEIRVLRVRDPDGQLLAARSLLGQQFLAEGDVWRDDLSLLRLRVLDLVLA